MNNISTDNFFEIKQLANLLQDCLNTELNLYKKPKKIKKKDEARWFLTNLSNNLWNHNEGLHEKYLTKIVNEREEIAINIEGQDQREYFKKVYNRGVINTIHNYFDIISGAIFSRFHAFCIEDEISEILEYNDLFENWYKECGIKEGKNIDSTIDTIKIKLQWKGQKNQLYNVLRQLKTEHELIGNSVESIADFLIQNVTGFENTKKETIKTEFKRNRDLRKVKRIKIEPGEAELKK